jgi:hypothetical protein
VSTAEEFAQHLQTVVSGTVYTSKLPAKGDSADDQWSVVADGGPEATGGNFLIWKQQLNLRVSYRHRKSREVYDANQYLLDAVATFLPTESPAVLSRAVAPMSDTDEDVEGRHTASWQVQLTISIK